MKLYTVLLACLLTTTLVATEAKNKQEAVSEKMIEVVELDLSQEGASGAEKFVAAGRISMKFALNTPQVGKINVVWVNGDRVYATIPMNVKVASSKWHGHSDIHAIAGEWKVKITDEPGNILSEKAFTVSLPTTKEVSVNGKTPAVNSEKDTKKIKDALKMLEPEKAKAN